VSLQRSFDHPLATALAKLARADEHIRSYESAVMTWVTRKPYSLVGQPDPTCTRHEISLDLHESIPFMTMALCLADAAHNMRTALDHAAWALSRRSYHRPPKATAWPITSDVADWERYVTKGRSGRRGDLSNCGLAKIEGIHGPQVRALIRRAQPCFRSDDPSNDPLAVLANADNMDKHQIMSRVLFLARPEHVRWSVRYDDGDIDRNVTLDYADHLVPAQHQAVLFTVYTDRPAREVQMDTTLTFEVFLALASELAPTSTNVSIGQIRENVGELLGSLERFFDPPTLGESAWLWPPPHALGLWSRPIRRSQITERFRD